MSLSTLDRWIAAGRVQIRKEPHGQRHRVYVVMAEGGTDGEGVPGVNTCGGEEITPGGTPPDKVSLAVTRERVRGLEEMVEQLKEERDRYADLLEDLRTRRLVVGETERQRPWWRFWGERS